VEEREVAGVGSEVQSPCAALVWFGAAMSFAALDGEEREHDPCQCAGARERR
jgi:hypothetical protein